VSSGALPLPQAIATKQRVDMMRDGIINYSGTLVANVIGVILVPIVLAGLGAEAYGFWIGLLAITNTVATFDFGLSYTIIREVAASSSSKYAEVTSFVRSAGMVYLAVGVIGALTTATLGLPLSGVLHLSHELHSISMVICLLAGAFCFTQLLLTFGNSVLNGLARFDAISKITIATSILRAIGTVTVLWAGGRLMGVAVWQVASNLFGATLTFLMIFRIDPDLLPRIGWPRWTSLRGHIGFSLISQCARSTNYFIFEAAPALLVGGFLGSSAIVPLYLGQKFPVATAQLGGSAVQVLFAHSGRYAHAHELMRDFIRSGTRWMTILTAGPTVVLAILAPNLLHAWIGKVDPTVVLVFRITALDVFLISLSEGNVNALWGLGDARAVLAVTVFVALVGIGLMLLMIPWLGVAGAAWGMLLATCVSTILFIVVAARKLSVRAHLCLVGTFDGLLVPLFAAAAVAAVVRYAVNPQMWPGLLTGIAVAGIAYLLVLYRVGAHVEEKELMRELLNFPFVVLRRLRKK
jgi:O-antigen/teichoic acid export membrane protein